MANLTCKAAKTDSIKKVTDGDSGMTSLVEVNKQVAVQLFYGSKLLELAKCKNEAEALNADEMISVLTKLHQLVIDGALDAQVEAAAVNVKARFKK